MGMPGRPNCIQCIHYYVTYNPVNPYGCRAMGFKSSQNPALLVYTSSGIECQVFKKKISPDGNKESTGGSRGGLVA